MPESSLPPSLSTHHNTTTALLPALSSSRSTLTFAPSISLALPPGGLDVTTGADPEPKGRDSVVVPRHPREPPAQPRRRARRGRGPGLRAPALGQRPGGPRRHHAGHRCGVRLSCAGLLRALCVGCGLRRGAVRSQRGARVPAVYATLPRVATQNTEWRWPGLAQGLRERVTGRRFANACRMLGILHTPRSAAPAPEPRSAVHPGGQG
eukprot:2606231-Rhodomonas_salina.2